MSSPHCLHALTSSLFLATALAFATAPARAATYVNPAGGGHIASSICPAVDGLNILSPDPVEQLAFISPAMIDELTGGDTPFPGWTYQSAVGPLTGTFNIDTYQSRFVGTHNSGALIVIRYVRGLGDPPAADLRWVQLITTNAPIDPNGANPPGPPTSPYMDPYPDDADGQGGPFYYSDQLGSKWDYRKHISGANYDAHFEDFAKRPHPPTSYVTWSAELFLTQLSAAQNVIFHEGLRWGFEAGCINWGDLITYTMGTPLPGPTLVTYDPGTQVLAFAPSTIGVVNQGGSYSGVDPIFMGDPVRNAQMLFTPFTRVSDIDLPPGLALFRGGSVQIVAGTVPLFSARIPYLLLGDDMHGNYNMTGVYADIQTHPSASPFLQQYEAFRAAGVGSPDLASDRSSLAEGTSDVGTYPFSFPGHGPQFYARTATPVAALLAGGGSTPVGVWHSFGGRNPERGLLLRVDDTALTWGGLGPSVFYDVVRGDLGVLRSSGGDFSLATVECLADDTATPSAPYPVDPASGQGFWFLVRAKRGSIVGTYDTLQLSQPASRDAGIAVSAGQCP